MSLVFFPSCPSGRKIRISKQQALLVLLSPFPSLFCAIFTAPDFTEPRVAAIVGELRFPSFPSYLRTPVSSRTAPCYGQADQQRGDGRLPSLFPLPFFFLLPQRRPRTGWGQSRPACWDCFTFPPFFLLPRLVTQQCAVTDPPPLPP